MATLYSISSVGLGFQTRSNFIPSRNFLHGEGAQVLLIDSHLSVTLFFMGLLEGKCCLLSSRDAAVGELVIPPPSRIKMSQLRIIKRTLNSVLI